MLNEEFLSLDEVNIFCWRNILTQWMPAIHLKIIAVSLRILIILQLIMYHTVFSHMNNSV